MKGRSVLFFKSFWSSRVCHSLLAEGDTESVTLAIWLVTCGPSHRIGLYPCSMPMIQAELGLGEETITRSQEKLTALDFAFFDAGWVFVRNMARYQLGLLDKGQIVSPGDKRIVGLADYVDSCPSDALREKFLREFGRCLRLEDCELAGAA